VKAVAGEKGETKLVGVWTVIERGPCLEGKHGEEVEKKLKQGCLVRSKWISGKADQYKE